MDETPEELERIRQEAARIDPLKYRKRNRALAAVALGALSAGAVAVVLEAVDRSRNPCDRVRDHFCAQDPKSLSCTSYNDIAEESRSHAVADMRSNIRGQCQTKIDRLERDEGIKVK